MATTTLDYLLPELRFKIGDYIEPYRYLDTWLLVALKFAVKLSQRYLKAKYLLDANEEVYRNPNLPQLFITTEDEGVIEDRDEPIIVLLASITTLEGSLENSAWSTVSWKDNEISFSNLEGTRARKTNLDSLLKELDALVTSPTKKLASPTKQSLPGYLGNDYERRGDL